jgi:hypothetical protein
MYAVTGITGRVGGVVARTLLDHSCQRPSSFVMWNTRLRFNYLRRVSQLSVPHPTSASQTQSANNRFRSGKSASPLRKKSKRSQSSIDASPRLLVADRGDEASVGLLDGAGRREVALRHLSLHPSLGR